MSSEWLWTPTPAFLAALRGLPAKEEHQVLAKLKMLEQDPSPDGKAKKKLKHMGEDLYRLRCGVYRVIYTYRDPYVSLLLLDRRNEDTYDGKMEATNLNGYAPNIEIIEESGEVKQPDLLAGLDLVEHSDILGLPETSCERGNKYLDRSVLVPTMDRADLAFFEA